jgi:hypothetical protein
MKRVVENFYGINGSANAERFAEFKADLFGNYSSEENAVLNIPTATYRAISIGTKGTTYANSTALAITSIGGTLDTDPGSNYKVGVFTKVLGNESVGATDDLGSAWFRTRVNTGATTPAGYSLYGVKSQLRIYATSGSATSISNWAAAGILGVLEVSGATTTFASGCVAAAGYFNVSLTTTSVIASGAVVAGVAITSASAAITDTGSAYFGTYISKSGAVAFDSGIYIANSSCTTGITIGTCTTAISTDSPVVSTSSARFAYQQLTSTAVVATTVKGINRVRTDGNHTSGHLCGTSGELTIPTSRSLGTGTEYVFGYGVSGQISLIGTGAVNIAANAYCAAINARLNNESATGAFTQGHISCVNANIYGINSGTSASVNAIYIEHAGGGVINSFVQAMGKTTYVFDLSSNTYSQMGTTGAATTAAGWLKCLIEGQVRYINLWSTAP